MDDIINITSDQIKSALNSIRLFQGGPPNWSTLPSKLEASVEREKRRKLFRKHKLHKLARKLTSCKASAPCCSGACPVCTRAFQRFLVDSLQKILVPPSHFSTISIVPHVQIEPKELRNYSISSFKVLIINALRTANIHFVVGGIDFSFNEHKEGGFASHWAPHVWAITNDFQLPRNATLLRKQFPRSFVTPVPVKLQPWDGQRNALGYMLKYDFIRRITQAGIRGPERRMSRISITDRLRSEERAELYAYLDRIGIESRMILTGVDVQSWPRLQISL